MEYTLATTHRASYVISRVYIKDWLTVIRFLHWMHNRRLDFVMTPDTTFQQGWMFEVMYSTSFFSHDEIMKAAGIEDA